MTTDSIRQLLSHPDGYRRDAWRDFLKALFPTAEIFAAPQPVTHPGEDLPDGFQLGRAMLADGRRIAFIEQPVPASTNLMRNRVGLRNRIARLIDQESATGVLAIFTDSKDRNFRLSFVARESSLTFTGEGTQTTKTETAPKRFTYYLGPDEACTTAAQRFELLLRLGAAASLPDLIDAFSVEKLNKEFFNDFSRRVSDIAAGLETTHPDWSQDTCRTEAQTLLNRLVFLYFVQRKGWLNRSRTFLTDAFKPHADQPGCTFFRSFLGPLFECLSTEPGLTPAFPHDVPFLNGGLFSDEAGADDPDIQRRRSLDVSNAVFRTVFQDLLDRYNFTIVEDSPSSVEVAIDPEMLGRVFEALVLQREESDTGGKSRRHDTGSHYTPRPIVHYLCREALAGWLENQPPFSGQPDARLRIDGLLALDASEGLDDESQRKLEKLLTAEEAAALARLLLALRMCDPAVGSGAFPLGFLHEMLNVIRLCETRSRGQDPAEGDPTWLYETKKQIIEQVIYGVDLQVPAIELCKLRLWLSLMVDHELKADPFKCSQTAFQKALRQLEPLPNLDFKIRAVNSLLELFHGQRLRLDAASLPGDARNHITALTKAKHQFYAASKVQEKRGARLAIHGHYAAIILLAIAQERGRYTARLRSLDQADLGRLHALTEAAKEADLILKLATSAKREKASAQDTILRRVEEKLADPANPSFLWHFDFAEVFFRDDLPEQGAAVQTGSQTLNRASKGQMELTLGSDVSPHGFDLVLGNPPYIRIQTLKKSDPELADYFKQRFHSASKGNYDLYVCFVERGLELLHAHGQLAYILPHKFFNAQYGQPLRELISKNRQLRHVVHFGDQQIFPGATNYVCLLFLAKAGTPSCRFVKADDLLEWQRTFHGQEVTLPTSNLAADDWTFSVGASASIKDKLYANHPKLGNLASIFVGNQTSADRIFALELLHHGPKHSTVRQRGGDYFEIESKLLNPVLMDAAMVPYGPASANEVLLFPYKIEEKGAQLIQADEMAASFPKGWMETSSKLLPNEP